MTTKNVKKLSKRFADGELLDQICYNLTAILKIANSGDTASFILSELVLSEIEGVEGQFLPFEIKVKLPPPRTMRTIVKRDEIGRILQAETPEVDFSYQTLVD